MEAPEQKDSKVPEGTIVWETTEYVAMTPTGEKKCSSKCARYIMRGGKFVPYDFIKKVQKPENDESAEGKEEIKNLPLLESKCSYESCHFAHGRHQLRCTRPKGHDPRCYLIHDGKKHNRRTTLCQRFPGSEVKKCPYGLGCNFYHCEEEHRCPEGNDCPKKDTTCHIFHDDEKNNYWTVPCEHFFNKGKATCRKLNCTYAHSDEELRCKYGNECYKKDATCLGIHNGKVSNDKTTMCRYVSNTKH